MTTPPTPLELARAVIAKYPDEPDKPSVQLARALLAVAAERDELRRERDEAVADLDGAELSRQFNFVQGARACREMMARFVEGQAGAGLAASIRANWNPDWGIDPDRVDSTSGLPAPPRLNAHEDQTVRSGTARPDERRSAGTASNGEVRADASAAGLPEDTRRALEGLGTASAQARIKELTARCAALKAGLVEACEIADDLGYGHGDIPAHRRIAHLKRIAEGG